MLCNHINTRRLRPTLERANGLFVPPPPRLPLIIECALDAIARQRAAGEPLDRVAGSVARAHRLGPRERTALGDLVFGWAHQRAAVEERIHAAVARRGGRPPPLRERDLCALLLVQQARGGVPDARARAALDPALALLLDEDTASTSHRLPGWLEARLRAEHDDADALLAALGQQAPIGLALDPAHASVDDVVSAVRAQGAAAATSPLVPSAVRVSGRLRLARLPRALQDALWPMDEGSQAIAHAVDARPGERVLDLCAGAGIKTRLLLQTGARVVAADVGAERLLRAPRGAARVVTDGTRPGLRARSFDKVLLDAPCSGTGTLRRAPDLAYRVHADDVTRLAEVQGRLLDAAIALTKPGGVVIYATCSLLRAENEAAVEAALARAPGLARTSLAALWRGRVMLDDRGAGELRLLPHRHGTDGFYLAALRVP